MKRSLISAVFVTLGLFAGSSAFAANADCEAKAAEKKLAGAAKTSFVKKCEKDAGGDASAMCDKSAADKKLAGAAKNSHVKKCMEDAKAKKPA
jgi:hypothetical protein